jgi:hypothetical protein
MRKTLSIAGALFGAAGGFNSAVVSYMHVYKDEPPFSLASSAGFIFVATAFGALCGFCVGWIIDRGRKTK